MMARARDPITGRFTRVSDVDPRWNELLAQPVAHHGLSSRLERVDRWWMQHSTEVMILAIAVAVVLVTEYMLLRAVG